MQSSSPSYQILKDSYRELQSQMEAQFLHSAIEQIELFLKYNPGHALAHNDLGVLYYRKSDKLQALGHYQKATRLAPENLAFQKNLANFHLKEMGWADEAFGLYQEVLLAAPDDAEALLALATISSGAGKSAEARAFMERILALYAQAGPTPETTPPSREEPKLGSSPGVTLRETAPQPAPATRKTTDELYLEACGCAEQGRTRDAIGILEGLVADRPDHALAHNDLGVLYLRNGDHARSLEHHQKACALKPDHGIFAKNLVGLYLDQGMTDEAIYALLDQLKRHPADVEILAALGNLSLRVDRPQEAKTFFEKVLALEPWNQVAREAVAALDAPAAPQPPPAPQQHDMTAATPQAQAELASLEQLLARLRSPAPAASASVGESAETLYGKALQAADAGRLEEATDRLEGLIASYPDFAPAHNDLGVLYYQQGDPGRALARHRQAVSLAPENLDFKKNLAGLCLAEDGTLDEAILLLTQIVKSHPGDIETLFALGRVCRDQRRPEEAKIFLRRLLEYEPWHREAQDLLKQVSQAAL